MDSQDSALDSQDGLLGTSMLSSPDFLPPASTHLGPALGESEREARSALLRTCLWGTTVDATEVRFASLCAVLAAPDRHGVT